MKRKNDRSAKIVLVTSSAVVLLVGVSVFSLYSLSKNDGSKGLTLAASMDTNESTNSKFLSKMKDSADAVVAVAATAESIDQAAADVSAIESEDVPSTTTNDETASTEDTQPEAELSVTGTTVDAIVVSESEGDAAAGETTQTETTTATESVTTQSAEQTAADATKVMDAAGTEQTTAETTSAAVSEYAAESAIPQEGTAAPEEIMVVDSVVDTDTSTAYEEESYEETAYLSATEYSDSQDAYYDSNEWSYTEDTASYEEAVSVDSSADTYAETSYDDGGEWIYDYDTEEWKYVYDTDDSYSADASYTYEDTSSEESYEYESSSDESYDDGGEWIYDYDTEEWTYVYDTDDSYSADEYTYEETSSEESYDYDDTSSEESYSYDDAETYDTETYDDSEEAYDSEDYYDNSLGQQIVNYAMSYVGYTPYVWAGRSLDSGTDCSGFINLIYADFGIYCSAASLAYDGSSFGYIISQDELQPGDIVVYGGGDHVAIYAGDGYVVHCSSPENGTVYWNMYYRSDISWFLRVL